MEEQIISPSTRTSAPPTTTSPQHNLDAAVVITPEIEFELKYEEPLYTEINIPLPKLARLKPSNPSHTSRHSSDTSSTSAPPTSLSPPPKSRARSRTLSSLSPFRRPSSLSSSTPPSSLAKEPDEEWPRIRKDVVKSREVHAMMDLAHASKRGRRGTIDALAVVPAVLVLSAELFTPGSEEGGREGKRKDSGVGRWEEGIR
ncbi:Nn.00g014290.m01.CDS01 [Neocucurbitaria sp. VM-36]